VEQSDEAEGDHMDKRENDDQRWYRYAREHGNGSGNEQDDRGRIGEGVENVAAGRYQQSGDGEQEGGNGQRGAG
jgi:hypothetical protein